MKRILSLFAMLMLCGVFAFAQNRVVTGTVTDDKGATVEGASIRVKGSKTGTAADVNGNFKISVAPGATLVFSGIGIIPKEVTVGESSTLNVSLVRNGSELNAVIVTAQGIKRRAKELGYSAAQVTNQDITVGRSPQLAQSLSGKVSGLAIYNVDNSVDPQVKVVLRGYRSLTGSNDALIVVDGIPNTSQSTLSLINPNDIESVTILKGGQAATLYGSQGVNGALVITTKKGVKGKLKVSYSSGLNFDQISFLPKFQSQYGNGSHYANSFGSAGYKTDYLERMKDNWRPFENQQYGDAYDGSLRIIGRQLEDGSKNIVPYSAIPGERKRTFDRGYTLNNQIGFSGGDDFGSYYMSVENNKTLGIVPGDESRRTGVRIAATKTSDKFILGFNAAYVQKAVDATTSDFYFDVLNVAAHIPISQLRDWQNNKFANPNGFYDDYYNNPYFNKDNNRQNYKDANLSGNIEATYKLLPWLSVFDRLGIINNSRTRKNRTGKFTYTDYAKNTAFVPAPWDYTNDYDGIDRAGTDIQGAVLDAITNENVINNDIQGQLAKNFGQFTNKMIVGFNVYQRTTKQTTISSGSIVVPGTYNVSNRQGELGGGEANTQERKYGYYADLTSGWRDLIFLHGSFRYDATSRFFKNDRKANLYSFPYYGVDVSAIVTDIVPSLKGNVLNYAKLRLGFNRNGNDNIDLYGLDLYYNNGGGFPFGNNVGITVGDIIPDANLKPEFVNSYEAGGEFQFWKGRIDLSGSVYNQTSKGQVLTVKIPNSTGFPNTTINVGETKNWGYETDLKVQVVRSKKINWELNGRFSYNDNKVVKLYPGVSQFAYGGYSYASTYVIEGSSFPRLLGQSYSRDPATGRVLVSKTTGYPLRESKNALHDFGRTIPKYTAGWGTKLRFDNITLAANFEYRGGNVIFHQLGRDMTFTGSGAWTSDRTPHVFPNSSYDDGTGKFVPNNDVRVREAEYALWVDNYRFISENFVTPGWFIKLRDVNLSYNIPSSVLKRTKFITAASFAIYGRNLFTIVDKSNMYTDPEFSFTSGNGQGINNTAQTPPVRQLGVNLNLTF